MDPLEHDVANEFAKRLKAARMVHYPSARHFAKQLGIDDDRYRHWERGTAQPSLTMLTRICRYLFVDPNHLLPYAVPPKKRPPGNNQPTV